MITGPWAVLLTVLFSSTGVYAATRLARLLAGPGQHGRRGGGLDRLVETNHLAMSAAMVLMVWRPSGTAGTVVQAVVFGVFGLGLVLAAVRSRGTTLVDLAALVAMDAAMVWMLAAMPLLMGGMAGGGEGHHHHGAAAGAASMGGMEMGTAVAPSWVGAVNWVAVGLMALATVWWIRRAVLVPRTDRGGVVHLGCHLLMSAGMAVMLVVMSA